MSQPLTVEKLICPDCGSSDLEWGATPLRCSQCGWHYLHQYPCRVCGGKSESVAYNRQVTLYGCPQHPITLDEWQKLFGEVLRYWKPKPKKVL